MSKAPRLMIPGPIDVTDEVLEALRAPVIPHYGDQWVELYTHIRQNLKRIAETDGDVFVMVGSGTAGIDAAIGSAVATGEHMIVVDNGFFSGRMEEIAAGYGIVTHVLPYRARMPGHPWRATRLHACTRIRMRPSSCCPTAKRRPAF